MKQGYDVKVVALCTDVSSIYGYFWLNEIKAKYQAHGLPPLGSDESYR